MGCELLSKIIIFVTRHNVCNFFFIVRSVVNCFQKLLSSWHETTFILYPTFLRLLWIAFKNYYLRDTKQPIPVEFSGIGCCELLSKIIIFVTRNNGEANGAFQISVVNCFQKLLSSWHETTCEGHSIGRGKLWIGFKNYYLRDTKQLNSVIK